MGCVKADIEILTVTAWPNRRQFGVGRLGKDKVVGYFSTEIEGHHTRPECTEKRCGLGCSRNRPFWARFLTDLAWYTYTHAGKEHKTPG